MLLVRAQEQQAAGGGRGPGGRPAARVADARGGRGRGEPASPSTLEPPPDLVVYGDAEPARARVRQPGRNAIQYNHEDGTVAITARVSPATGDWVADQVVIVVANSGASIPEEERERVFERFYRLDPSRSRRTGGAGLGLAISREIVQLFKGTIRVVDSPEPGTTIEVGLPGGLATAL